jgi:hypothetical protein
LGPPHSPFSLSTPPSCVQVETRLAAFRTKLHTFSVKLQDKDENKTVALSTAKINYMECVQLVACGLGVPPPLPLSLPLPCTSARCGVLGLRPSPLRLRAPSRRCGCFVIAGWCWVPVVLSWGAALGSRLRGASGYVAPRVRPCQCFSPARCNCPPPLPTTHTCPHARPVPPLPPLPRLPSAFLFARSPSSLMRAV